MSQPKAAKNTITMQDTRFEEWTFPGYDLLDDAQSELTVNDEELKRQARLIEEKLGEFEIEVTVRDAHPGPTVTQFTLQPAEGVKLSRIGALKDDLALALAAPSLRIEAPIPGKSLVGIEMPNIKRTIVHLREIMESPEFVQSTSNLTLPLGRDVGGKAIVAPLNGMPHILIAGATGSGKSVCMNTFLISLLYQNAPDQLKLILIDPKRVELVPYDGIPHLLTPVITEAEKALQALRWAVAEMGRRLHRFSEQGVRNIDEYNEIQTEEENVIPRVVIVIDELADLMMRQFRRDTEMMVVRIAQMARATGMHLVIATQRPSVDVITGLIKANVPSRIAFRTVSSVDSRTILDGIGAEDLLGKGDMLYLTAETPSPMRVQGIFVSTKEVERVINAVKIAGGGKITEEIPMDEMDEGPIVAETTTINLEADDNGGDDLFFEAVRVVQETGRASASLLQRQLKVGYARAARLLDIMEDKGIDDVFIARPPLTNLAIFSVILFTLVEFLYPNNSALGWLGLASGAAILAITGDYILKDKVILNQPYVVYLSLIFVMLAAGYALMGLAILGGEIANISHFRHFTTSGGYSLAYLMVMIIIGWIHTGRHLTSNIYTHSMIALIVAATLMRGLIPFYEEYAQQLYMYSSIVWTLPFMIYIKLFFGFLLVPRADGIKG